jgi:hypothetical protein
MDKNTVKVEFTSFPKFFWMNTSFPKFFWMNTSFPKLYIQKLNLWHIKSQRGKSGLTSSSKEAGSGCEN